MKECFKNKDIRKEGSFKFIMLLSRWLVNEGVFKQKTNLFIKLLIIQALEQKMCELKILNK